VVEQISNEIRCAYTDGEINALLGKSSLRKRDCVRHFNQNEEFFLRIEDVYNVPHLPIHHDVRESRPRPYYLDRLKEILAQLIALAPQVFQDLTYLFDPSEILRPCFFKLYRVEEAQYLYLVRLDLMYRPQAHRLIARGDNDRTASYSSDCLFVEAAYVPIREVRVEEGKIRHFLVRQTISNTWVDETGRGYFVQGIWIDNELTKFFSRLFLPAGKRTYPFYPYICKYKTICQAEIHFSAEDRRLYLPYLHRALRFLEPSMPEIEASMKNTDFSEENDTFRRLKRQVPDTFTSAWQDLRVEMYLNAQDMKEFRIAF
jgi:hypothetical protein